jgi:hypothetical protein
VAAATFLLGSEAIIWAIPGDVAGALMLLGVGVGAAAGGAAGLQPATKAAAISIDANKGPRTRGMSSILE